MTRSPFDGLPAKLYLRSPLFYWIRYIQADPGMLALGGKYYGEDFWYRLNHGWLDIQP